ncbi:MAG: HDIG domain-containing protein [Acidobacteriia bacterium]|nr:HDIG domain-containing protein [Terriglobia bacterium]
MLNRQSAYKLLLKYTRNPSLIRHALAVEACMIAYAENYKEDREKWGIIGLLHDFDYEKYPNPPDHPDKGTLILRQLGYPEDIIYAIRSHASWTKCPRLSLVDKVLFACDELSGFITAVSLVRPDRKIKGLEVRSVRKKLKDKAFARSVSREDILNGAVELEIGLTEHISFCIKALQRISTQLDL